MESLELEITSYVWRLMEFQLLLSFVQGCGKILKRKMLIILDDFIYVEVETLETKVVIYLKKLQLWLWFMH